MPPAAPRRPAPPAAAAHWLTTGLPLVVATPLLGLFMNLDAKASAAVTLTLLAGIERTQTMVAFQQFSNHDLEAMFGLGLEDKKA